MKAKERKERKKKMNESLKSNEDQINKLISKNYFYLNGNLKRDPRKS